MNKIHIKRTSTTNPPTQLDFGELAWSENGNLYIGRLNGAIARIGGEEDYISAIAIEPIHAGDLINIYEKDNNVYCRKATSKYNFFQLATGFARENFNAFDVARVYYKPGSLMSTTQDLALNANYYLSSVPGMLTGFPPASTVQFYRQRVGVASGRNILIFNPC